MSSLVDSLKQGIKILSRKDDDSFDRLSNRYTIGIIMSMSLFLATKTYVGDPIDCFTPKEFEDNWIKYTDNYCWIKNTYYVPMDKRLPGPEGIKSPDHNSGPELSYYQWVPIILAFMMFVFAIPVYFWKFAMWSSGYDLEAIIKVTCTADNINPETRDKTNKYLVRQLDRHITYHRRQTGLGKIPLGNKYGRYLFIMYTVTKCLYIAVPVILLFILGNMMGPGYLDYGYRALQSLSRGDTHVVENPMFPRITYCDFAIRKLANVHRYTVQCVLTVNLFNEKVFLLLWWWLVILAGLSAIGLILCLIRNLRPNGGNEFIMKYLGLTLACDPNSYSEREDVKRFTNEYLSLDGVFCMRMIAQNTTDVMSAELVAALYKKWRSNRSRKSSTSESHTMMSDETN